MLVLAKKTYKREQIIDKFNKSSEGAIGMIISFI